MAKAGAEVVGIDVSEVSLQNARKAAAQAGVSHNTSFISMDAESMAFPDNTFNLIMVSGVLHHLDVRTAFPELSRVLKPDGHIIAGEALGHNPIIQWYRRRTPDLRTAWETEHIIKRSDLLLAGEYFGQVDFRFFHLATLAAVPFRKFPGFHTFLSGLDIVDRLLLSVAGLRWQAWQVIFGLADPIKSAEGSLAVDFS